MASRTELCDWAVLFQRCYGVTASWIAAYLVGGLSLLILDAAGVAWAVRAMRPVAVTVTVVGIYLSASIVWDVGRRLDSHPAKRFFMLLAAVLPGSSLLVMCAWTYLAWSFLHARHVKMGLFGITRRQMLAIREGFCLACGAHLRTLDGFDDRECSACDAKYPLFMHMIPESGEQFG